MIICQLVAVQGAVWPVFVAVIDHTWTFCFLKTRAAAALEERFFGNIGGGSSRCGGRCPLVYHTHREKERSKTKIKPENWVLIPESKTQESETWKE